MGQTADTSASKINITSDTYIDAGNKGTNYDGDVLSIEEDGGGTEERVALLSFPIADPGTLGIPTNSILRGVTINVSRTTSGPSACIGQMCFLNSSFTENQANWYGPDDASNTAVMWEPAFDGASESSVKPGPLKGLPIERVIVHTRGARLFNGKFAGNVPTVKQMGNKVAFLSKQFQYLDHPFYGNYYKILDINAEKDHYEEDFILLNWHRFKDIENSHFFGYGKATRFRDPTGKRWLADVDSFILSAHTKTLMKNLLNMEHGWMPLYFDMTCDTLIKKEAIGPKDVINHNIMMRILLKLMIIL